jgi:hypothetical protein
VRATVEALRTLSAPESSTSLGVSFWQDAKPTNHQGGRYGVFEYYLRVSYFAEWIRSKLNCR